MGLVASRKASCSDTYSREQLRVGRCVLPPPCLHIIHQHPAVALTTSLSCGLAASHILPTHTHTHPHTPQSRGERDKRSHARRNRDKRPTRERRGGPAPLLGRERGTNTHLPDARVDWSDRYVCTQKSMWNTETASSSHHFLQGDFCIPLKQYAL
jgi:hypothetical protein